MAADIEFIDGVPSFTVTQFSAVLNEVMKSSFDGGVWIEGEIEGFKRPNPHAYFSIVEKTDKGKAQVNITIWASDLKIMQSKMRNSGIELKDGLKVRLYGQLDFYAPQGKLSLKASKIDPNFSLGDLATKRDELIRKLLEQGVDKINKRVPVPLVPLRLGVVSSSTAAGWADAEKHLLESGIGFSISFIDVRVQGEYAVPQVVQAINALSRRNDIDIVLVMRGGGSKGDLAAFDDEKIAMAISRCAHPVFTAIGHQIDTSVADLVAHSAHKTPTACAQAVIGLVEEFLGELSYSANRLRQVTENSLVRARGRMALAVERLRTRTQNSLDKQLQKLERHAAAVRLLDPITTMARGWSITRDGNGNVVRSTSDVKQGDTLVTLVADGSISSTVEGMN